MTAEGDAIHLYVMETDHEILFKDSGELMTWLKPHRAEALREPAPRPPPGRSRFRKYFEWR